jgi:hypothetical protein
MDFVLDWCLCSEGLVQLRKYESYRRRSPVAALGAGPRQLEQLLTPSLLQTWR